MLVSVISWMQFISCRHIVHKAAYSCEMAVVHGCVRSRLSAVSPILPLTG